MAVMSFAGVQPENIERYVAGEERIKGRSDAIKLSSNENPFGPGPLARQALADSLGSLERYPSSNHEELRAAISHVHGLDPERLICGAGSDEILGLLCRAFASEGSEVVHTRHGFLMYAIFARSVGASPVEVQETDRRVDVDSIIHSLSERTRLIFIANPGNPTGTMLPGSSLLKLADSIPEDVLLVVDGAYAEFADFEDGALKIAGERPNVVATRTFSKIHGLASLRIGYGYGPGPVIDLLDRLRGPFNLTGPAQAAASAAIRDREHQERSHRHNSKMRKLMIKRLVGAGVACDDSQANFVLARFGDPEEADGCDAALKQAGIIVRRTAAYNLPNCLRITVGDDAACRQVCDVIDAFRQDWSSRQ